MGPDDVFEALRRANPVPDERADLPVVPAGSRRRRRAAVVLVAATVALVAVAVAFPRGDTGRRVQVIAPPPDGSTLPVVVPTEPSTTAAAPSTGSAPAVIASTTTSTPVPRGFQAVSVTAISPSTAWILGSRSCRTPPCTSILRTADGFGTFAALADPPFALATGAAAGTDAVSKIRFASERDGWAWGPGLWSTHDGGRTWHGGRAAGDVGALEAGGGRVVVITSCTDGCAAQGQALVGPTDRDDLRPVDAPGLGAGSAASMAIHGQTVLVAVPGALLRLTEGRFVTEPGACAGTFAGDAGEPQVSLAAATDLDVFALCLADAAAGSVGKVVVRSADGGRTWVRLGEPPRAGTTATIAAASPSTLVVGASSGATAIDRSVDGGATWATATTWSDGGRGLHDLGFTSANDGFAVRGSRATAGDRTAPVLERTTDAGRTWRAVVF